MCGMQFEDIGTRSGSAGLPLPGFDLCVLDPASGQELGPGEMGSIALRQPLPPGFMTTVYNDNQRFQDAYMNEFPGFYAVGLSEARSPSYLHVNSKLTGNIVRTRPSLRSSPRALGRAATAGIAMMMGMSTS